MRAERAAVAGGPPPPPGTGGGGGGGDIDLSDMPEGLTKVSCGVSA